MDIKNDFSPGLNEESFTHPQEQQLRITELNFQNVIAEVEDYAVILLDRIGTIISWNKGAQLIKGYSPDEIIGKSHKLFYPAKDIEDRIPEMLLQQARETGRASLEGWRIRKDGTRFWGSVTITAVHGQDGSHIGFLKLTRDLTPQKLAEDRLSNVLEELRLKNDELQLEEQRYHKMVSEVRDYAIILLDTTGKILDWNKGAEKLKGYAPAEIIGKNFRLFYTREDKEKQLPQHLLNEALRLGSITNEGYRIRKDGSRFWGSVTITALHDDNGNTIGFSKVTKDLTDKKIAEDKLAIYTGELKLKNEELRKSEERYHKMISEVQDYAILLLDKTGTILNWNTGAEIIKGYTAAEIIGQNFSQFYTLEDVKRKLPQTLLNEALEKGSVRNEGWRKRKDGSTFWGSVVITALHDAEGQVIGFSKVTRDLTERKHAEDVLHQSAVDLKNKNRELEKLNKELSSLAYIASHDLKEPIRKIQVFANRQLEPGKSIEQLKYFSDKILSSASRMQKLMDALISYSTMSAEDNNPQYEKVNLNDILATAKEDLEVAIADRGVIINSDNLPEVNGVTLQLNQVFVNLLSNAIKFTPVNKVPQINISVLEVPGPSIPEENRHNVERFYKITFTDNGIGFEERDREKIFELFRRVSLQTDPGGTGIGLAIVKKIAQNHKGFVAAEAVPNQGAKFHVYLPVN